MAREKVAFEKQGSGNGCGRERVPPVDIYEAGNSFVVLADMPGVRPDNLEIRLDGRRLLIRGRRTAHGDSGTGHVEECIHDDYARAFTLGEGVDRENIAAELRNGVLRLTVPKAKEQKVKKIAVTSA